MPNPRLANRYAKSLISLSMEKNNLEEVHTDMKYIQAVCTGSRDFTNLLRSPIIKADKKENIVRAVTQGKVSKLTETFLDLLIVKGRESNLPEIAQSFIDLYNEMKGIHYVKLTTAQPISDELKNEITGRLHKEAGLENVELQSKVQEKLIGGFILEFNNNLVDASILRDLRDVRKQFNKNVFIQQIR
ncbi:MAG: ATP synthase F1 subunit delta [Bacteroidetes bacterium]|nr:ATP synthase F1 subunit delta [Bacteroidota bacterium]